MADGDALEVWRLYKGDGTVFCTIAATASGFVLQVDHAGAVVLTAEHARQTDAMNDAERLRGAYVATGWSGVPKRIS